MVRVCFSLINDLTRYSISILQIFAKNICGEMIKLLVLFPFLTDLMTSTVT